MRAVDRTLPALFRASFFAIIVFASGLSQPALVLAQSDSAQRQLNHRYEELVTWLDAYKQWEAWILKWGNKVAYNAAGGIIKDRPLRPEPPDWLWADCATVIAADGALGEACDILDRWEGLSQLILSLKHVGGLSAPTDLEEKSSFLQRVHLSGGWVPAQLPAPKIYLAVGMQVGREETASGVRRGAEHDRRFARDADVAQAVGTVRGDLEVDDAALDHRRKEQREHDEPEDAADHRSGPR